MPTSLTFAIIPVKPLARAKSRLARALKAPTRAALVRSIFSRTLDVIAQVNRIDGVIVVSGFIGRYIYTRIPRTADGIEDPGLLGVMQAGALANARRLMSLWHTIHIPIGTALFIAAFAHIAGALYYATLLK